MYGEEKSRGKKATLDVSTDLTHVESAILEVRGERVILDSDLAALYGGETKRLNEQVKRNPGRFGENYAIQLTAQEFESLRSQSATSNRARLTLSQPRAGR